jgi:hypothetical protein
MITLLEIDNIWEASSVTYLHPATKGIAWNTWRDLLMDQEEKTGTVTVEFMVRSLERVYHSAKNIDEQIIRSYEYASNT